MLKELGIGEYSGYRKGMVLILILMEHAQRVSENEGTNNNPFQVLILILMEHAQRVSLFRS